MHVRLHFPGPLEGEVTGRDEKDKKVDISAAEITPFFFRPDAKPAIAHLESLDSQGNVIRRYMLIQSGNTGEISLIRRTPCTTKYDREKYPTATDNLPEEADMEDEDQ